MAEKPYDAVVKFNRNLQRHRVVLPVIARLLLLYVGWSGGNVQPVDSEFRSVWQSTVPADEKCTWTTQSCRHCSGSGSRSLCVQQWKIIGLIIIIITTTIFVVLSENRIQKRRHAGGRRPLDQASEPRKLILILPSHGQYRRLSRPRWLLHTRMVFPPLDGHSSKY